MGGREKDVVVVVQTAHTTLLLVVPCGMYVRPELVNPNLVPQIAAAGGPLLEAIKGASGALEEEEEVLPLTYLYKNPTTAATTRDIIDAIHPSSLHPPRNNHHHSQQCPAAAASVASASPVKTIVMSALIFISIIAVLDVIRNILYTFYPLPTEKSADSLSQRLLCISLIFTAIVLVISFIVGWYLLKDNKRIASS